MQWEPTGQRHQECNRAFNEDIRSSQPGEKSDSQHAQAVHSPHSASGQGYEAKLGPLLVVRYLARRYRPASPSSWKQEGNAKSQRYD